MAYMITVPTRSINSNSLPLFVQPSCLWERKCSLKSTYGANFGGAVRKWTSAPQAITLVTKTAGGCSGTLRWCEGRTVFPLAEDHLPGSPSNRGLSMSVAHRYHPSNTRVRGRNVGMRPIFVLRPGPVVGARGA